MPKTKNEFLEIKKVYDSIFGICKKNKENIWRILLRGIKN
jgi:hypothetical protein